MKSKAATDSRLEFDTIIREELKRSKFSITYRQAEKLAWERMAARIEHAVMKEEPDLFEKIKAITKPGNIPVIYSPRENAR